MKVKDNLYYDNKFCYKYILNTLLKNSIIQIIYYILNFKLYQKYISCKWMIFYSAVYVYEFLMANYIVKSWYKQRTIFWQNGAGWQIRVCA